MERLPDEIIVEILSRLPDAREVVVASATCKGWRRAMQHLKSLKISSKEYPRRFLGPQYTITQTIQRTRRLESLSIYLDSADDEFLANQMRDWLLHTRDSLRELSVCHRIPLSVSVVADFRGNKLEVLKLYHVRLVRVKLGNETLFPYLKTLTLQNVKQLSALRLCNLLALCPKIEDLSVYYMDLDPNATLEWSTTTFKNLQFTLFELGNLVLEAANLESLEIKWSSFKLFKLVGNTSLKVLDVYDSGFIDFNIGGNINRLEQVDLRKSNIKWLCKKISESSNLRRL